MLQTVTVSTPEPQEVSADKSKMRIFISWSGDRSRALAAALHGWLPVVLHYVQPWMSSANIRSGDRWGTEVAQQLDTCDFGILCLTPENLTSAWILFEAGALAKSVSKGRVVPLVLDLDVAEITFPLGQFQARKADEESVRALVRDINKSAPTPLLEQNLEVALTALWPSVRDKIQEIPAAAEKRPPKRSTEDVLEELVLTVRRLDARFGELTTTRPHATAEDQAVISGVTLGALKLVADGAVALERAEPIADVLAHNYPHVAGLLRRAKRSFDQQGSDLTSQLLRSAQKHAEAALLGRRLTTNPDPL
jgi:hypothetical protein